MTALCCSRHNTAWNGDDAVLCPVCTDDVKNGGKAAHMSPTPQEESDWKAYQPDTPRVNYARSCGTSALTVEACKLERELAEANGVISKGKWRCAKTDKPPEGAFVLVWYRASYPGWRVAIGEVSCGHWRPEGGNGNFDAHISHWMPLPAPPCERCGDTGLVTLKGVPNGIGFEMDADDQPCPECKP